MSASGYDRVWLITGCSTGFGRQLAERVFAAGEKVVATARSVQALYDMGRDDEERILRLPLDVCDAEQVASVVTATIERFGRIDVLVNNGGPQPLRDERHRARCRHTGGASPHA